MGSVKELGTLDSVYASYGEDIDNNKHEPVTSKPRVHARLEFDRRGGPNEADMFGHHRTNAAELYFTYPLKLMLPTHASSSNCQWVYSINYGGGIVSGDNIEVQVKVRDSCCVMLTTQASTKVYHSEDGMTSQQRLEGRVGAESTLAVLQDPVTCFAAARYRQFQTFHVEKGGSLVFMDWLSAGRIARGERWDFTSYSSCNSVFYNGALVHRDAVSLESTPLLGVKETMGRYNVVACCVLVGHKFNSICKSVLKKYGAPQDYGVKPRSDLMITVSPVEKTVDGEAVPGAIIKLASDSVNRIYEHIEDILQPVFPMLGGNPFEDKH